MKAWRFPWWVKLTLKLFKQIKTGDISALVIIVIICIVWFLSGRAGENLTADIYLDGEKVQSIALSELDGEKTVKVGGCEILLRDDGAAFLNSKCADKLCEKRGMLKRAGDTMACVPERVVLSLKSDKASDFDSVVY